MWTLIKKNLSLNLIYLAVTVGLVGLVGFLAGGTASPAFLLLSMAGLYLLVIGGIFVTEQYEDKHNGYRFLGSLPLSTGDIAAARFIPPLALTVIYLAVILALPVFSPNVPGLSAAARSFLLLNGAICLLFTGLLYVGIMGIGYLATIKVVLFLGLAAQVVFFLLASQKKVGPVIEALKDLLGRLSWPVLFPLVLVSYVGLMALVIKVKNLKK